MLLDERVCIYPQTLSFRPMLPNYSNMRLTLPERSGATRRCAIDRRGDYVSIAASQYRHCNTTSVEMERSKLGVSIIISFGLNSTYKPTERHTNRRRNQDHSPV